ncbi:H-NS family nucleoid-associated regulatory protein [Rhodopseudomonas sp. B29]|uniref:H-NS histone family protein n=1 Tax=Rhodopseudomonas sp. B29 TaxID=95607 RepID=UPI0003B409F4|nr:H-NS histone family protein [Rhodopseudomonas sp. B29]
MRNPDSVDLDAMQFDELWALHEELTKILSDRLLGEKRELEKRLAKLNQTEPSEMGERGAGSKRTSSRRGYPKVLPKYFNPSVPHETWSGRGKRPRWLALALEQGRTLDDLKIKQLDGDRGHESFGGDEPP